MKYIKIAGAFQCAEDFSIQTPIMGFIVDCDLYTLSIDGILTMKKYYAWDGPTGGFNTKNFIISSGFHDILCEMINSKLLPPSIQSLADELMSDLNSTPQVWKDSNGKVKHLKMSRIRQTWTYISVRWYQWRKKEAFLNPVYKIQLLGERWVI